LRLTGLAFHKGSNYEACGGLKYAHALSERFTYFLPSDHCTL